MCQRALPSLWVLLGPSAHLCTCKGIVHRCYVRISIKNPFANIQGNPHERRCLEKPAHVQMYHKDYLGPWAPCHICASEMQGTFSPKGEMLKCCFAAQTVMKKEINTFISNYKRGRSWRQGNITCTLGWRTTLKNKMQWNVHVLQRSTVFFFLALTYISMM